MAEAAVSNYSASVTCFDFSASMLELCRDRLQAMTVQEPQEGAGQGTSAAETAAAATGGVVSFVEGNAEAMPFPDNSFDSISCNYGTPPLSSELLLSFPLALSLFRSFALFVVSSSTLQTTSAA